MSERDEVFDIALRVEALGAKIKQLAPPRFDDGTLDRLEPSTPTDEHVYRRMAIKVLIEIEPFLTFIENEILPEIEKEEDFNAYIAHLAAKRAPKEKAKTQ
jgi:hypothetical protein